jgi:hypothetical protein
VMGSLPVLSVLTMLQSMGVYHTKPPPYDFLNLYAGPACRHHTPRT